MEPSPVNQLLSYSGISKYFKKPECSLPCSQGPATDPFVELDEPSLYFHLRLGLPSGLFPSGFPNKTLCVLLHPFLLYAQPIKI
jgi:hypothetical protein